MKEMAQIVNTLLKDINECHKTLNTLTDAEESAKFRGRIESLEYAIKQIEDALYENVQVTKHMSIKQRRDDAKTAVSALHYLLTGERGTHGTEESN